MTQSASSRAFATVHGFKVTSVGKNIGCIKDPSVYKTTLAQNSSLSTPLIHESQTDTLVIDFEYITNTG